jgi:DNA (cytosine-5)-methyltransferase 1
VPQQASGLVEIGDDDIGFLTSSRKPRIPRDSASGEVDLVDIFAGAGGLSVGLHEAARHRGINLRCAAAFDTDPDALSVYAANIPPRLAVADDVRQIFAPSLADKLTTQEREFARQVRTDGVLAGGPPCQGHSDLNNSTRRDDPKNSLYFMMARAAKVFRPATVIIENVPAAVHDRGGVVQRTRDALVQLGYHIAEGVIDMTELGVPQTRKRFVMVASTRRDVNLLGGAKEGTVAGNHRTVRWAIGDLANIKSREHLVDRIATPNAATRARIDFLFDNRLHDLPDSERPACHRLKTHSYVSIYGRLHWDRPAPTITRGFYCMCMGRYVHPSQRRTLTAHEAARLQFFPDWFDFSPAGSRTKLAIMIGNAVPPKIGFALGLQHLPANGGIANAKR